MSRECFIKIIINHKILILKLYNQFDRDIIMLPKNTQFRNVYHTQRVTLRLIQERNTCTVFHFPCHLLLYRRWVPFEQEQDTSKHRYVDSMKGKLLTYLKKEHNRPNNAIYKSHLLCLSCIIDFLQNNVLACRSDREVQHSYLKLMDGVKTEAVWYMR